MAGVDMIGYVAMQAVSYLPSVILLVVGISLVAARRQRLTRRSGTFAIGGLAFMLVTTVISAAWSAGLVFLIDNDVVDTNSFGPLSLLVGVVLTMLNGGGLGLLIAAVLTGGPEPAPPTAPVYQ
ncbi:hypothetical protein Pa4123_74250 [Phytohabitans aurantiacus]|uniref:MotA/TolQ/ExbB proton channel domain-containing protein n=1 Tax=Phytohabitans aurantiacus TaxID=3016789 RepID=A0ABQ5R5T8_9ACTN|nr:hypothetical protein Pa4123_74250 [Phytohabitans aurantiacus]